MDQKVGGSRLSNPRWVEATSFLYHEICQPSEDEISMGRFPVFILQGKTVPVGLFFPAAFWRPRVANRTRIDGDAGDPQQYPATRPSPRPIERRARVCSRDE